MHVRERSNAVLAKVINAKTIGLSLVNANNNNRNNKSGLCPNLCLIYKIKQQYCQEKSIYLCLCFLLLTVYQSLLVFLYVFILNFNNKGV